MDMRQHRDYVAFCFHLEYFGTCAVVQATDGDAYVELLFRFLPLSRVFRNLLHYLDAT